MIWSLVVFLVALWVVAMVLKATLSGLIHLLLVVAFVVLVYRLVTGRKSPLG